MMKRSDTLTTWLNRDFDKLNTKMEEVVNTSEACDQQTKVYTQVVERLQASEDRNDEFLKNLL